MARSGGSDPDVAGLSRQQTLPWWRIDPAEPRAWERYIRPAQPDLAVQLDDRRGFL